MSEKFPLGAKVIVSNANYPSVTSEATVVKVARVNVYIEQYGRQVAYDKETGIEKRSLNAGGPANVIRTPEMVVENERQAAAVSRLANLGLRGVGYGRVKYSADTLERVIEVLEQGE